MARLLTLAAVAAGIAVAPQQSPQSPPANPKLTSIRTVCVDVFAGDPGPAATAKEMAFAALFAAKRFTLTERCDKADAVLKGAVMQASSTRVRAEGEGAGFGVAAGAASTTAAAIGAVAGGSEENLYSKEQQLHASLTMRLMDADGVVLWAYTQESTGGKRAGPLADAVDRALRQLKREIERAEAASKGGSS